MINYFGGPEGGGKTALMTRYCRIHHLLGGEIWAFPGYEHKNNRGRVVSQLVLPEDVMKLLDDMFYIVFVIDEIQNFMNHHSWQSKIVDILAYGAAAQRRKRQFVILATGPQFKWLPPDLRMMFHIIFNCEDRHWKDHSLPRGEQIKFTETDMRGVLSGKEGTTIPPRIFRPKPYFKFFDTFSLVDPKYQHLKLNIKKDEVFVDSEGNRLDGGDTLKIKIDKLEEAVSSYLDQNNNPEEIIKGTLGRYLKSYFDRPLGDYEFVRLGRIMRNMGYQPTRNKGAWKMIALSV